MNPQKLIIIGAGGFGREVLAWAAASRHTWTIKGFLDDNLERQRDLRLRAPVLARIVEYVPETNDVFVCAIGSPVMRRSATELIKRRKGRFVTLIHPSSVVADGAQLGEGAIICPLSLVSADARVGEGAVVYYHSSVDHDAVVGPFAQISGHCDVMGGATLGTEVFLGSHTAILPHVTVGDRAVVGAGSVVTRNVRSDVTVLGVPAKPRVAN